MRPTLYPLSYVLKTFLTVALLWIFRKHYTKIRWNYAWLGALVGVLVLFQWVGMEKLLPDYPRMSHDIFDPTQQIQSHWLRWSFIAVRWAGASLVVPVMEEFFLAGLSLAHAAGSPMISSWLKWVSGIGRLI